MIQKEIRAKAGFEAIVSQAQELIARNEEIMNAEIESAVETIKAKYSVNLTGYEKIIADYSEEIEIEVADPEIQIEEVVENSETFQED